MSEARLVAAETGGLIPESDGWFVLNAREAEVRFPQVGINLNVLEPGEPMTMCHRENAQEDFLVLAGECVLIVEGAERPLRQWDFFHCPAGVDHAIVGAGKESSIVLAVGARTGEEDNGLVYPADPVAQKHGAAVAVETSVPAEAYDGLKNVWGLYREGRLPG